MASSPEPKSFVLVTCIAPTVMIISPVTFAPIGVNILSQHLPAVKTAPIKQFVCATVYVVYG